MGDVKHVPLGQPTGIIISFSHEEYIRTPQMQLGNNSDIKFFISHTCMFHVACI